MPAWQNFHHHNGNECYGSLILFLLTGSSQYGYPVHAPPLDEDEGGDNLVVSSQMAR